MKKLILFFLVINFVVKAQKPFISHDIFKYENFIENKGQYNLLYPEKNDIKFFLQSKGNDIFIRSNGFSFLLQRANLKKEFTHLKKYELKELEEKEELYHREKLWVDLVWIGANPNATWELVDKSPHYFTFGEKEFNAHGYKKLICKNLYPGVDLIYSIHPNGGLEYEFELEKASDLSKIKFEYKNASSVIRTDQSKGLIIDSKIRPIYEKGLKAFGQEGRKIDLVYHIVDGTIFFQSRQKIEPNERISIDPWVTSNTSLAGLASAANKAYDVDFDADGNLFVIGGGGFEGSTIDAFPKIAKYDINGNLLWTFSGQVASAAWNSSPGQSNYARVGNMVVDKATGKTYMSQGLNVIVGARIIRLDPMGNYDNFVTLADPDFLEIWEMKLNCIKSEIIGMGGGTSSNINFGLVDPISGVVTISNGTGNPSIAQDMVCATIGVDGDIYSIFSAGTVQNQIFKITPTYNGNFWSTATGYGTFAEQMNKPHVATLAFSNGYNALHASKNYLFYYDGLNLKCFDKATGVAVGNPKVLAQTALMQGGIYANDCDEVFVGGASGEILKFKFDGINFNALPNLSINGQNSRSTYDIVYNNLNEMLYVCGDQFVATISPNSACTGGSNGGIDMDIITSCNDSAFATIINGIPTESYTFVWYDESNNTEIKRTDNLPGDFTDFLSGMDPNKSYKLVIILKQACQILSGSKTFQIVGKTTNKEQEFTLCPSEELILPDGSKTNTSGIYIHSYKDVNNCDSVITTKLFYDESLCPCKLVMPNAFSPNGDKLNDKIKPLVICENVIENYEFLVFNRWGQLLFKTNDIQAGWDGKYKNELQGLETYFYTIRYKLRGIKKERMVKGDFILIK